MNNKAIILLGIKHSGKSTQGALLAEHFNCPFIDIDDVITQMNNKTPREIYSQSGVSAFMKAEEEACHKTAEENEGKQVVIATGGGICDNAPALEELRKLGAFVLISVPEKIACDRIIKKAVKNPDCSYSNLPAYISKKNPADETEIREIFHKFYAARMEIYNSIADVIIDTKNLPKQENSNRIIEAVSNI